jgi:RND family efflux transporter MFP subunit
MTSSIENSTNRNRRHRWRWLVSLLLCIVIVAIALGVSNRIKKTAPKARKKAPSSHIPYVESIVLLPKDHQIAIHAMGTVIPAREVVLKSRVPGEVQSLHPEFADGGFVKKGAHLLKIDPKDYELALARKKSQLVNAQYELKVEMGYQEVAKREWSILNKGKPADPADVELALRKPHLAKTRSDVVAAEAELEQAKLNLSRTDIKAPFNALVQEKYVDAGSQVSSQDALAELVGTDEYWIRVSIPVDRLKWMTIPKDQSKEGSEATVHFRGHERTGRVIRMLGNLETQGRMARILVSVKDPLGLNRSSAGSPPLLIGEYVRVTIQGKRLSGVYRIPIGAFRDNNTVWLVDANGTLEKRDVETLWRDDQFVLIEKNLSPGDRLITSDLATAVDGLPVATEKHEAGKGPSVKAVKEGHHES